MLEHLPHWIGALFANIRAGHGKLAIVQMDLPDDRLVLDMTSPAFVHGGALPARCTADGKGLSPPLDWSGVPVGTSSLALLVEDADAPLPDPIVHALLWNIPADARGLTEGAIHPDGTGEEDGSDTGLNSLFTDGWLPPDPPGGHGSHDYVFQLFALAATPDIPANPNRSDMVRAMKGHVLAAGMLVGTYARVTPA